MQVRKFWRRRWSFWQVGTRTTTMAKVITVHQAIFFIPSPFHGNVSVTSNRSPISSIWSKCTCWLCTFVSLLQIDSWKPWMDSAVKFHARLFSQPQISTRCCQGNKNWLRPTCVEMFVYGPILGIYLGRLILWTLSSRGQKSQFRRKPVDWKRKCFVRSRIWILWNTTKWYLLD